MPTGVAASIHTALDWYPRERDLKRYLHFDRDISSTRVAEIANDPAAVKSHSFFPLLLFHESWTKFRKNGVRKKKTRPLRYASRLDAAIYARYRCILSERYERELSLLGIQDAPVAYRKIPKNSGGNKCNIEIAKDVFDFVKNTENCIVTVVDIKSYFESLDHDKIKQVWMRLLGGAWPADHNAIFKNISRYSVVDVSLLQERLGLQSMVAVGSRKQRRRRRIDELKSNNFRQLCSASDFRVLVAGKGSLPSLIQKNGFDFGIPQGTPISDIIANFYLLDFDVQMHRWASARGGIYKRYSDDIIIVIPTKAQANHYEAKELLQDTIRGHGRKLRIQDRKVAVVEFAKSTDGLSFSHHFGSASKNGLEYLGFEFDGRWIKLRNSTLSNAWRKMKKRAYGNAARFVKQYRLKGKVWLAANYPAARIETEILRNVTVNQDVGFKVWTFTKYVRRCITAFQGYENIFAEQTTRYRRLTKKMIDIAFNRSVEFYA
jgi:hypothetical protein